MNDWQEEEFENALHRLLSGIGVRGMLAMLLAFAWAEQQNVRLDLGPLQGVVERVWNRDRRQKKGYRKGYQKGYRKGYRR